MSLFDAGCIVLFVCLIGYLFRSRLPRLRRYLRIILVVGVLLVLVGAYIDWNSIHAAFMRGWNAAGPQK